MGRLYIFVFCPRFRAAGGGCGDVDCALEVTPPTDRDDYPPRVRREQLADRAPVISKFHEQWADGASVISRHYYSNSNGMAEAIERLWRTRSTQARAQGTCSTHFPTAFGCSCCRVVAARMGTRTHAHTHSRTHTVLCWLSAQEMGS